MTNDEQQVVERVRENENLRINGVAREIHDRLSSLPDPNADRNLVIAEALNRVSRPVGELAKPGTYDNYNLNIWGSSGGAPEKTSLMVHGLRKMADLPTEKLRVELSLDRDPVVGLADDLRTAADMVVAAMEKSGVQLVPDDRINARLLGGKE